ncbi:MAG: hypothetical protein H0U82_08735 [Actinobacteria bacterium]|nr:hypothetical protein [Actinomycetota bacterium]
MGRGSAWVSVVLGVASVFTLPLAVYATRFNDTYELLHAAFAIPIAAGLALAALALAGRACRLSALRLGADRSAVARAGRVLGIVGLGMAASALVSLGVYGLLEYVGSRD